MPDDKMNLTLFIRDEKKQHIQTKIVLNDLNDTVYPLGLVPGSVVEIAHLRTMFAPTESYLTSTYGTIVSVVGFDESWEDLESMPLRHLYEFLHSNTLDDDSYVVEGHFTNLLSASSSVSGQSRKIDVQDSFVLIFEFTDGTASVQILLDQNSAKILNPHVHSAITSKQSMAFSWRRPQDPPDVLTPLLTSGGETFSKYWRMLIVKIKYTRMFRVLSLKAVDYAYASANILRSLSFKS